MRQKDSASAEFHKKYIKLYEHIVIVTMKDGSVIEGGFYDEFYEDKSILISELGKGVCIIKIADIIKMELSLKD